MTRTVTLFLCGDVMTGRGVDQILWHPNSPELHEPHVHDARDYVEYAEAINGSIPRPVAAAYIWGDAIAELERAAPDVRIVNLETSITSSGQYAPEKSIHYRMHPAHAACLTAARLDVCTLANNHVLDYGYDGLLETLSTLQAAAIRYAGAGIEVAHARRPAIVDLAGERRVVVFSLGAWSSGVPRHWAATATRAGVDFLEDLSDETADRLLDRIVSVSRAGDVVIVSLHWGSNWGYDASISQVRFAHRLLDGDVALVHGHSSHHPRPIEVYNGKLILYGCGDFLTDYEGISGYEEYRGDLCLMYFPTIDVDSGSLLALRMTPMRVCRMQTVHATPGEADWLCRSLTRASERFGRRAELIADGTPEIWLGAV